MSTWGPVSEAAPASFWSVAATARTPGLPRGSRPGCRSAGRCRRRPRPPRPAAGVADRRVLIRVWSPSPPRDMLMTVAPWSAAQRCRGNVGGPGPFRWRRAHGRGGWRRAGPGRDADAVAGHRIDDAGDVRAVTLRVERPSWYSPRTSVPGSSIPARSGWVPSTPVSTTATVWPGGGVQAPGGLGPEGVQRPLQGAVGVRLLGAVVAQRPRAVPARHRCRGRDRGGRTASSRVDVVVDGTVSAPGGTAGRPRRRRAPGRARWSR